MSFPDANSTANHQAFALPLDNNTFETTFDSLPTETKPQLADISFANTDTLLSASTLEDLSTHSSFESNFLLPDATATLGSHSSAEINLHDSDLLFLETDDLLNPTNADSLSLENRTDISIGSNTLPEVIAIAESDIALSSAENTTTPGVFTVGQAGQVSVDFLFDGGKYQGELAIFSLEEMDQFEPGSEAYIQEAARRALSSSELGHIVIDDRAEGARFSGNLGERDWNRGDYIDPANRVFTMKPGTELGLMLVPKGSVAKLLTHPNSNMRPLFSMDADNAGQGIQIAQMADDISHGHTLVFEDQAISAGSDQDYNDLIVQIQGATGTVADLDQVINPAATWRNSELGQQLVESVAIDPLDPGGNTLDEAQTLQPISGGSTYTGWVGDLDTEDYHQFTLGTDNDFNLQLDGLSTDAQVDILDLDGTVIQTLSSVDAAPIEFSDTLGTGTYYLRITVPNGGGTAYNLKLKTTPKLDGITTDGSDVPIFIDGVPVLSQGGDTVTPQDAQSNTLINLDAFQADNRFAGIDGSGFATVVLDTGIDLDDPFFGADLNNDGISDRIVYHYDFADGDADGSDVNGHGSNVTSIVASEDSTHPGMAPGADIIHLKVFKDSGAGQFSYTEQALQWVVANADTYNIASVNMSLGDSRNWNTAVTQYGIDDELAALAAKNVITVSAAGNDFFSYGSAQGIAYPAADPNSLAVGAVYDGNVGSFSYNGGAVAYATDSDRITPFSQRHDTLTDIFAPGAPITGAGPDSSLVTQHGTSQAAPHIAGIAVLAQDLAQQELGRRLTPGEYVNLLQSTGVIINDGDDENDNVTNTGLNFTRVDVLALGEAILAMGTPTPAQDADLTGNDFNVIQEPRNAGNALDVKFDLLNQGAGASGAFDVDFYLSTNDYISAFDRYLGSYRVNNVDGDSSTGTLTKELFLPGKGDTFWNTQGDDQYAIGMIIDADDEVIETNETNNRNVGEFDDYDALAINNTSYVDLWGSYFNVNPEPSNAGERIDVEFEIENTEVNSSGSFDVDFYISTNSIISTGDRRLGGYTVNNVSGNSDTGRLRTSLTLPGKWDSFWRNQKDGTYYIGMIADANDDVKETRESNNRNTGWIDDYDDVRVNDTYSSLVNVTINRAKGDLDRGLIGGKSDFYSRISINGDESRSPTIGNDNDIKPYWSVTRSVTEPGVPIDIQLWDSDGGLRGKDDHADIDPQPDLRDVNIWYDLRTGSVSGDLIGRQGRSLYSKGNNAEIWFTVSQS